MNSKLPILHNLIDDHWINSRSPNVDSLVVVGHIIMKRNLTCVQRLIMSANLESDLTGNCPMEGSIILLSASIS